MALGAASAGGSEGGEVVILVLFYGLFLGDSRVYPTF